MRKYIFIACAILAFVGILTAWLLMPKSHALKWLVCYSADLKAEDVRDVDWAIVASEIDPKALANGHTKFIAYLSVGEAEERFDYWDSIKDTGAIVEKNPQWEGDYLVDVRSKVWQKILLDDVLPKIYAKGFDGVFLDTLDTAPYLEERDPKQFAGSVNALVRLVKEIRKRYPKFLIVPNNAVGVLVDYADAVDAALVEDLYTRYDFELKKTVATPAEVTLVKEALLDLFKARTGKPVLNILYAETPDDKIARDAISKSRAKGYGWYLSGVDLMKVGVLNP